MVFRQPLSRRVAAALLMTLFGLGAAGPAVTAMSLVTSIPVGTYPSWVSIDPSLNRIYVTNFQTNGSVSVIDGNSNQVIATILTGDHPRSIALNLTTHLAYVTNQNSNTIAVIDLTTYQVLPNPLQIPLPWHIAVNPTTNRGYVTQEATNQVSVLDLSTSPPTVIDTISTGSLPLDVVVDSTRNLFYYDTGGPTAIYVYDGATDTRIAGPVTVGGNLAVPDRLALNTQTNRLYVSLQVSGPSETVVDTISNTVVASIPFDGEPDGVAVDEATNRIYVGDLTTPPGFLWQIDGATNTIVSSLTVGNVPLAVGLNPQTHLVYTANAASNDVSVVNPNLTPSTIYLPAVPNGAAP